MKPYFEKDGIVLYHGDAREVLPHIERADLLLTDPPYGVDGGLPRIGGRPNKARYIASEWNDTQEYIIAVCVPIVEHALAIASRGILTPGYNNMMKYPQPSDVGALWQPASGSMGKWGWNTFQPIFYYGKDPRSGKGGQTATGKQVTSNQGGYAKAHPCAKPLPIWQWLMAKGSLDGETVLDPFCGAGTTLRAAKNLRRKAIGIEIEERYCELTVRMLAQEVLL